MSPAEVQRTERDMSVPMNWLQVRQVACRRSGTAEFVCFRYFVQTGMACVQRHLAIGQVACEASDGSDSPRSYARPLTRMMSGSGSTQLYHNQSLQIYLAQAFSEIFAIDWHFMIECLGI
jgi:hypothetical protein